MHETMFKDENLKKKYEAELKLSGAKNAKLTLVKLVIYKFGGSTQNTCVILHRRCCIVRCHGSEAYKVGLGVTDKLNTSAYNTRTIS